MHFEAPTMRLVPSASTTAQGLCCCWIRLIAGFVCEAEQFVCGRDDVLDFRARLGLQKPDRVD